MKTSLTTAWTVGVAFSRMFSNFLWLVLNVLYLVLAEVLKLQPQRGLIALEELSLRVVGELFERFLNDFFLLHRLLVLQIGSLVEETDKFLFSLPFLLENVC